MRALTWHGKHDVRVDTVPDPQIVNPRDAIIEVTATAICGSDLHLYDGVIPGLVPGDILGHEFMGRVVETGPKSTLKKGDRVVVPFTISCGACFFCAQGQFSACDNSNPVEKQEASELLYGHAMSGLFGYSHMTGGYPGGQAEYVRVPFSDVGPIVIPDGVPDEQVLFLSDILPTGYQAVLDANVAEGSTVAIFGAGPVGLMAAACCRLLGAERVFMVDHIPYRLAFAEQAYGVIPINFAEIDDPAEYIVSATAGRGVDASIEAVGFEAEGSALETVAVNLKVEGSSGVALRQCIAAVRRGGTVSVPGVYAGFIHGFLFGDAFDKGLTFKMGQTHAQALMPELLEHVGNGLIKPEIIISHRMRLADAAEGYATFDKAEDDCRKVVLTP